MKPLKESIESSIYEAVNVPDMPDAAQKIFDQMSDTDVNKVNQELDSIFSKLPVGSHQNAKEICQDNVLVIYGLVKSRNHPHNVQLTLMTIEGGKAHILKIDWLYNQPATEWVTYDIGPTSWVRNRKDDKDFKYVIAPKSLFDDLVNLTEKIATKRS